MFINHVVKNCLYLLLFTVCSVNAKQTSYQYYAMMAGVISPFLEYHPVIPLNENEIDNVNYYRVLKNDKDELQEIAYFENGIPSNNSYFKSHKVTYTRKNKNEYERKYFDIDNAPAFMWRHYYQGGDIHIERYTRSKDARTVILLDDKSTPIESGVGSHKLVATKVSAKQFLQTQFKLDGSATIFRTFMPNKASLISVDDLGFLDKVINVDPITFSPMHNKKSGFTTLKVNFDEFGVETGWDYLDSKGNLLNQPSGSDEEGIAKWAYFRQWENRDKGLFKKMWIQVYDQTGASTAHPNGAAAIRYTKDDKGRYIEAAFLDNTGQLYQSKTDGFARRVFDYNKDGERTIIKYDQHGIKID